MPRFFVDKKQVIGGNLSITGSDAKHIGVLRMNPGDEIAAVDGVHIYSCRIVSIKKDEVMAEIVETLAVDTEPVVKITLFQGLPKAAKMETIIQKAVELGVYEIVPVVTERSISMPGENKALRWKKISEAAAKQSGRGVIPEIHLPVRFETAMRMFERFDECYVAWELEKDRSASVVFSGSRGETIGIVIGPEGGFSNEEISLLRQHRANTFSLGKRILRTETAGFAALICLMMHRGEF